ncbi:MAG TPA: sugar-binding protein, partial [Desulfosarcina sp.]|nr:sugar-binding protein [Desulfosarcina sp.]
LALKTVTVRATEYRTPETMPAVLPPTSAFTWCAELKVDGAERVRFEKPVVVWVDNFLGFPVGEIVPVGYYDRDRAQWKPMPNGVVVRLLDTDADGAVDALDADGDNQPDDLDADGSLRNEVTGLDDAQRYAAGATFWRAAVTHFSPIDFNWPLVLPADSIAPNPPVLAHADQQQVPERDSRRYTCSYVEEKSRIFHEDIPIPGTEFTLHYSSSRVQGYKPGVFSIPVSGKVVPASLENIIVKLTVAGRQFEMVLPPQPEQTAQFEWDGLDHLGRVVDYPVKAYSRIGYVYSGVYARPARVGPAFGQTGAAPVPEMIPSRQPMIRWLDQEQTIVRGKGSLAEGWTLSAHHASSPSEPTILIKGDGTIGTNSVSLIQTVAGDGSLSHLFGGMGGPGTKAQIGWPVYLTTDAAGNVYILTGKLVPYSHWDFRILKLDSKGIIDQLPVTLLGYPPAGLATDGNSNFYFSLPSSGVVYKTGPGVYQRIAGTDNKGGYSGDGGLAVNALLNSPRGLAIDAQGNLYIADYGNHVIRQMDPNGVIITAAGNGKGGFGGDGGPATEAELKGPNDVAIDRQGNLFIVDQLNYRVRKVDSSGVMTTVAGNGTQNYSGNGVAATDTGFPSVDRIEIDSADNLYILSSYPGNHVWKVDATGTVTTVAGSGPMNWGQGAYAGDGGPATAARLNWPMGIAIDAAGNLFIADSDNHRVRRVSPVTARINNWTSESDITFTEEAVGHILSASGRHLRTIDLKSGVSLFEFGYDDNGLLVSISDRFGNDTLIERGPGGIPRAIVSPDGLRTELTIDARNHLTRISYPDGGVYRFEYTETGLATLKVQPSGNRLVHVYDATGRLSGFQDEEGGDWAFSSSMLKEGDVLHETLTAEGLSTTQVDRVHASGAYQSMLIDPAGAQSVVSESADGLATTVLQSCGNTAEHFYDLDPQFKYKYLKKRSVKTPSGLKRETTHERTYTDADEDSIPDLVTEKHKVNNRTAVRRQDVTAATQQLVSPEGRSVTLEYDPATLAAERVKVPGLLETSYTYDSRGRLTQAAVGTRTTSYSYSEKGFLAAVTDPQNRTTSFSHDAVGRVTAVVRPDLSRLEFAYDANGNLALLVNPSG